jgi:hypothetical protein
MDQVKQERWFFCDNPVVGRFIGTAAFCFCTERTDTPALDFFLEHFDLQYGSRFEFEAGLRDGTT